MKNIILIKGNPKYKINPETKIFYKELKEIISKHGNYKEVESDGNSEPIAKLIKSKNDIIIGFSRGCGYKPYLKKFFNKNNKYIGIGCNSSEKVDISLKNPLDKTSSSIMTGNSLKNHWTITSKMKKELIKEIQGN